MTHLSRIHHFLFLLLSCGLIFVLSACDLPWSTTTSSQGPVSHIDGPLTISSTPTPATRPVSPTKTSCPASGSARALVTAPLATGKHQTIIYSVNQFGNGNVVVMGTLKSYDIRTGSKKVIIQIPGQRISWAEVSPDGEWILYGIGEVIGGGIGRVSILQAVRVDGQGQQTLYCAQGASSSFSNPQWSPD